MTLVWQITRAGWILLAAACTLLVVYFVTPLVYPFIIGWIMAFLLNPLVNFLHKRARVPRWLGITLSLLALVGILVLLLTLMVTQIVIEMSYLMDTVQDNIVSWLNQLIDFINSEFIQSLIYEITTFYNNPSYKATIDSQLDQSASTFTDMATSLIRSFFDMIIALISALPTIIIVMIISLLGAFFISKDWDKNNQAIKSLFPDHIRRAIGAVWMNLKKALFGFLRAQFILVSVTGLFVLIGLLILRVNYAISIALLCALFDLLPYLGIGAIMVPWAIYSFIQGNIALGIGLSILYGIILVTRQLIEPKVLASSVGTNPLATLISLFVGLQLWGVFGLIIGPVTLVLLSAFYRARVFHSLRDYIVRGTVREAESTGPPR